jgi:hypothetical protein
MIIKDDFEGESSAEEPGQANEKERAAQTARPV